MKAQGGADAAFYCPGQFGIIHLAHFQTLVIGLCKESLNIVIKCECSLFLWEISCHSEVSTISILISLEFQHGKRTEEMKNTSTKAYYRGQVGII